MIFSPGELGGRQGWNPGIALDLLPTDRVFALGWLREGAVTVQETLSLGKSTFPTGLTGEHVSQH